MPCDSVISYLIGKLNVTTTISTPFELENEEERIGSAGES
jgi:hypothetical protein